MLLDFWGTARLFPWRGSGKFEFFPEMLSTRGGMADLSFCGTSTRRFGGDAIAFGALRVVGTLNSTLPASLGIRFVTVGRRPLLFIVSCSVWKVGFRVSGSGSSFFGGGGGGTSAARASRGDSCSSRGLDAAFSLGSAFVAPFDSFRFRSFGRGSTSVGDLRLLISLYP